ncbi:MAG: hypothetical protein KGR69_00425 [Verrucomicrobia bacterium]|nr:hypothetical protein [Verrucomicrobiota bacterium]
MLRQQPSSGVLQRCEPVSGDLGDFRRSVLAAGCELDGQQWVLAPARPLLMMLVVDHLRHLRAAPFQRVGNRPT